MALILSLGVQEKEQSVPVRSVEMGLELESETGMLRGWGGGHGWSGN